MLSNKKYRKAEKNKHQNHKDPAEAPKIKNIKKRFRSFPRTPVAQSEKQRAVPQELLKKERKAMQAS